MADAGPLWLWSADRLIVCYIELRRQIMEVGAHDLTASELAALLPPRGPVNCYQNRVRGRVIKSLNKLGFTFEGRKL